MDIKHGKLFFAMGINADRFARLQSVLSFYWNIQTKGV